MSKIILINVEAYSHHQLNDILGDLDHIFETDSKAATLKFVSPIYEKLMEIRNNMTKEPDDPETKEIPLPGEHRFIEVRRLLWKSDILEQCQCALWVLWETDYDFQDSRDTIPISAEKLAQLTKEFTEMSQEERNNRRLYIGDGLYGKEGVDYPCPICGFQVEGEPDA